jgi:hypothetical protein
MGGGRLTTWPAVVEPVLGLERSDPAQVESGFLIAPSPIPTVDPRFSPESATNNRGRGNACAHD